MSLGGVSTFPNILSNDTDKDSPAFGQRFMQSAYDSWSSGYGIEDRAKRKARYDYNRAFAMGKQPMQEYKDILDLDGELSVIQLIYEPLPIAIPFLNRIKDRYNQRQEKISCNSIDPFTTEKKKKAKDNAMFKLQEKEKIMALQQEAGVEIERFSEDDPQSEKEIEIEFGYNYKEREEVIMQEIINLVFYDNDWHGVIKDRIIDDLINCGISGVKVYIDATGRIKIRFIRPENFMTSYSEWNDFRDWSFNGEAFYMNIAEIRLKYPNKISEEKLFELAKSSAGKFGNSSTFDYTWNSNYSNAIARPYDGFKVEVMELDCKTLYNLKYKKGEDRFGKETLKKVKPSANPKSSVESPAYYVSYTGVMIPSTNYVLEWGLSKNMVKPQDNLQEIISEYVVFMPNNTQMSNKPLIEVMIPTIKEMQLINLKQQAIIAAAMPDGYDVDISTMSDVDIGLGQGSLNPLELYKIKKQTGIGFYKRIDDDGQNQRREPITANNVPFSGKLEQLMAKWNSCFETLTMLTGENSLSSGQITNQAVSQTVVQQAQQLGASSSNYLYNGYLNIMKRAAKLVQLRAWDILVFGKKFGKTSYEGYMQALGTNKVEYIKHEATDDFEKTNFDVQIKAIIDDNQQNLLEANIQQSLSQKEITLADAIDVRKLAEIDVDYASYMLSARIDRRTKEIQKQAAQNSKDNTDAAVAAAQAKSQGEAQLEQLKAQLKDQQDAQQHDRDKEKIVLQGLTSIKADVVKGVIAEPTKSWQDIPKWALEGIGIVDQTEMQMMVTSVQQQQQAEAQQQQQAMAEQQASEQQAMHQQGMPPEMAQQEPPVAA